MLKIFFLLLFNGNITFKKIKNFMGNLFFSLVLNDKSGKFPSVLVLEPTDMCNLKCKECGYNLAVEKKRYAVEPDEFKKIIDDAADYVFCVLLYFAGEPFLHKNILEMIEYASKKGVAVIISTNGNFKLSDGWADRLTAAKCANIIFSVSGITQETYQKYHIQGDLTKLNKNIETLAENKKRTGRKLPMITVRYLITDDNAGELEQARNYYKEIGVDRFETRYAYSQLELDGGADPAADLSGNAEAPRKIKPKRKSYKNYCFWLWFIMVIKSDARVLPCCYEFFGIPALGNVKGKDIAAVWNSEDYRNFRRLVLKSRKTINCCKNCKSSIGFQDKAFSEKRGIKINYVKKV